MLLVVSSVLLDRNVDDTVGSNDVVLFGCIVDQVLERTSVIFAISSVVFFGCRVYALISSDNVALSSVGGESVGDMVTFGKVSFGDSTICGVSVDVILNSVTVAVVVAVKMKDG